MNRRPFPTQYDYEGAPLFSAPFGHMARSSDGFIFQQVSPTFGSSWRLVSKADKPTTIIWIDTGHPLASGGVVSGGNIITNARGTVSAPTISDVAAVSVYSSVFHAENIMMRRVYGIMLPSELYTSGDINLKLAIFKGQTLNLAYASSPGSIIDAKALYELSAYTPGSTVDSTVLPSSEPIFVPQADRAVNGFVENIGLEKLFIFSKWGSTLVATLSARKFLDFGGAGTNNNYRQDRIISTYNSANIAYSTSLSAMTFSGAVTSSNGDLGSGTFSPANIVYGVVVDLC